MNEILQIIWKVLPVQCLSEVNNSPYLENLKPAKENSFFIEDGYDILIEKTTRSVTKRIQFSRCTGSWGILAWGDGQLGEVPVGGSASWGKCQLGDFKMLFQVVFF